MSDRYTGQIAEGDHDDSPTTAMILLKSCGEAAIKLGAKITELEDRLEAVRVPRPEATMLREETTPARPIRSPLVNDLDEHRDTLYHLQRRVASISEQIEL